MSSSNFMHTGKLKAKLKITIIGKITKLLIGCYYVTSIMLKIMPVYVIDTDLQTSLSSQLCIAIIHYPIYNRYPPH